MALRFARAGNPLWPLPNDYLELTSQGKRDARVNVVRCRETADDDVISAQFFSQTYLNIPESGWYDEVVMDAPGHADWTRACHNSTRVIIGAARGMAKSTKFLEFFLRDAISIPGFKGLIVYSAMDFVEDRFSSLMRQLEDNSAIIDDFGNLKGPRGKYRWNHSTLELTNGVILKGGSVTMKSLRGKRPHRILADDLEFDPREGTNLDKLIVDTENLIFNVLLPMLRRGSAFNMIGTAIRRRLMLYRLISCTLEDNRIDPTTWFRKMYPGSNRDGSNVFWPDECPPEEVERRVREMGSGAGAEWYCEPTSGEETPLVVDDVLNTYTCLDDPRDADPLQSPAVVSYHLCKADTTGQIQKVPTEAPYGQLVSSMTRFVTVDPIRVPSPHSDFCVILVMGIDRHNQLWVLDIWRGKVRYSPLIRKMWEFALKWKVTLCGVESVAAEQECYQQAVDSAEIFAEHEGWRPQVVPLIYPSGISKEDRIQALEFRFRKGLVKLPLHLEGSRDTHRSMGPLFHQVRYFTPDLSNLEHDDDVDTLAMGQWLVRRRKSLAREPELGPPDPIALLKSGITSHEECPLSQCIDLSKVSMGDLTDALHAREYELVDAREAARRTAPFRGEALPL